MKLDCIQRLINQFSNKSKTLYLVRGIPGSGKSTLAAKLAPRHNVAADDFPGIYVDGVYQVEQQRASHQWCFDWASQWMSEGVNNIAVHNTFCDPKYLEDYILDAANYGYAVHIIHSEAVVLPSYECTKSIHNVPQDVIERMRRSFKSFSDWMLDGVEVEH